MKTKKQKPEKPRPDFPLFAHGNGQWAKKVLGKLVYFGPWDDPQGALERWLNEKEDRLAGREPSLKRERLTIQDLANQFIHSKELMFKSGEITERTLRDYYRTCGNIVNHFGKRRIVEDLASIDFSKFRADLAERMGTVTLSNEINRIRMVFKFGYDNHLIEKPVRWGTDFKKPSVKLVRRARRQRGERMFTPEEIHQILDSATVPMRAMVLLAINCGFGQTDIANLPFSAIDLDSGWVDYPRPKTEVDRRCPLWPETVSAVREVIEKRPDPNHSDNAELVFLTRYGAKWVRFSDAEKESWTDAIGVGFAKLLRKLDLKRDRINFYSLRHVFRTVADESKDQPAINHIMGHTETDMASVYRERISDERLKAVSDYVHGWLFSKKK